ncbi:MAG TPA: hypothetical protein PLJ78_04230 [Anaerolineae bacterium]|nr:hypothetical protein [Anaerolineae bacterium]HQK13139.1 hypothetical protein [Anaerolineae bacterium]
MNDLERETNQNTRDENTARVETLLARTIAPQPPPESLRRQVRKQVAAAWERRPLTLGQRVRRLLRMPAYQRAWASVAALALVAVVAALAVPSNGVPVAGTVVGKTETVAAALVALAVIAIVIAWIVHKHRH